MSVSNDGSTFQVSFGNLDPAWSRVQKVKLSAVRSTIWWTVPNITSHTVSIYLHLIEKKTENGVDKFTPYDVEVKIPKGLYGYGALNTLIDAALVAQNIPKGTFTFYADYATQKIVLKFKWLGSVRFGGSELAVVLGFMRPPRSAFSPTDVHRTQTVESGEAPEWQSVDTTYTASSIPPGGVRSIEAPFSARFDHIQYFNIQTSLADGGLYGNNGVAQNVIAQVLIDRRAGEQIVYDPNIPIQVDTSAFSNGHWPSLATFTLLDDKFRPCDTNGQPWTITIRLQEVHSDIESSTGLSYV